MPHERHFKVSEPEPAEAEHYQPPYHPRHTSTETAFGDQGENEGAEQSGERSGGL